MESSGQIPDLPRFNGPDLRLRKFKIWLTARGAELLVPTNGYELLRYKAYEQVAILYTDKTGNLSWQGGCDIAWIAFRTNGPWRATKKVKAKRTDAKVRSILARDGTSCFYCGLAMAEGEETLEHLVPASHGGPNHLSNLFLAHRACNERAGHRSGVEKIRFRDRLRKLLRPAPAVPNLEHHDGAGADERTD